MKQTQTANSEILIYSAPDGAIKIDVRLENETVWLTQAEMAKLFQVTPQSISIHLKNIYEEGELSEEATCKDFLQVQIEGSRKVERQKKFYNLDAIISVGYRVKSRIATEFRIWATQKLKEYIVKGFALNDERFKSGSSMNYFAELQERIREIRLSERFFYQKIKDIYTTSIDYDPNDEKTREFFKIVQNKLLWAISRQTAAELVYRRIDASLPLLGMQSYDKTAVAIKKHDVSIAKNYLAEDEIKLLGLLVEQYLAFAEAMAQQRMPMYMADWINRLDTIIQMNGRELLNHAGKISHEKALEKSAQEYNKFRETQKQLEYEESLKELERDIKDLKKQSVKK
ncbi:MAG: cell filamentation protein Fic [Erysipelotrichia bacterium]|nr:cell filamentation protein Fic [Erysipelotrichia bacterium]